MANKTRDHIDYAATLEAMQLAFQQFALLAKGVTDEDVAFAKRTVESASAVGFVIDPTAYRNALYSGSLERQQKLVALFAKTKTDLKALFPAGWD